jgi:glycosyltransferase involved in cell wall biosynthesis
MSTNCSPLSIAIPTYNRCDSIVPLANLIISQMGADDELLIIDDGSKDETTDVLSKIKQVRLISNSINEGMVKTWNKCLTSALHDWVCIIHDDDTLSQDALKTIRSVCDAWNKPAIIGHHYSNEGIKESLRFRVTEPGRWTSLHPFAVPSGVTIHKSIIESVGLFDEQFQYSPDIEYFSRIGAKFTSICIDNPKVVSFNLHDQNYEFKTWVKPDFIIQLEQIERLMIKYAELSEAEASQYFYSKMNSYVRYILNTSSTFKDRELLRKVGNLMKDRPYLGRKNRLSAYSASLVGWIPKL